MLLPESVLPGWHGSGMGQIAAFDRERLADLLRKQSGVLSRSQAADCSLTLAAVRHRIRTDGPWRVILPGVYLTRTGESTARQREMAALLYAGRESAITGAAALRWHGIRAPRADLVDVLVPVSRQRQAVEFVRLHRTTVMPGMIFPDGELRYAPPARAVADAVRFLGDTEEVRAVVASAVQRGTVQAWQLAGELRRGPVQGSARFRMVLGEVADGVRSVAEGDLRTLVRRARLPEPVYNPRLYLGGEFLASPDAWWHVAALAVEVDSREWHLSPADWELTLARHARMSAHGIVVLHYPPRRLRAEPRAVATEIRHALKANRGRELPGLRVRPPR